MKIPTFREVHEQVAKILREQGGLAAVLVDLGPLAHIERSFGGAAFQSLRSQIDPVLVEMKDKFRQGDLLTRDEREGDRYLLFLGGRREGQTAFLMDDLRKLADRVEEFVAPRIGRLSTPYMRERPIIDVGYSLVVWSPLENEERQVLRLIEDALEAATLRRRLRDRDQRESLLDVIYNRNIWTAFQTIVEIDSRKIMQDSQTVPLRRFGHEGRDGCECSLHLGRETAEPSACGVPPGALSNADRPLQALGVGRWPLLGFQYSDGIEEVVERRP